jgi:hypothetical protein
VRESSDNTDDEVESASESTSADVGAFNAVSREAGWVGSSVVSLVLRSELEGDDSVK